MNTNVVKNKSKTSIISLILCVIIPSVILIFFKNSEFISPINLLLIALFFPFSNSIYELFNEKKISLISILGFVSIFFTGIVGILALDPKWIAIKEALIPFIIFLFLFISASRKKPVIGFLVDQIVDQNKLNHHQDDIKIKNIYLKTTYIVSASFLLSSMLNFILAKIIVKSTPGSVEFNHELGILTAMSYPVIVIPSMLVLAIAFLYLFKKLKKLTGLDFTDLLKNYN